MWVRLGNEPSKLAVEKSCVSDLLRDENDGGTRREAFAFRKLTEADHVPLESENTSQSRSSQSFCLMSRRRLTKACSFPVITAGACESGGNVYCG